MRLILVSFNNVVGLKGVLSFVEGKPLLIYGENIAGKSNIINLLRYCLIPKWSQKRGYREEKRLKRNEILLEKNSAGSIEIYFFQNNSFYKLYFYFSRKGKNVSQKQKVFQSKIPEIPVEDEERLLALQRLKWKDLGISTLRSFKEKLVEIGIHSEILDILFSPSNVRIFSEAINGSVVRVPDIIWTRISKIHTNARKYLDNIGKLYGIIILEKEKFEEKTKKLMKEFLDCSKNLPQIDYDEIFARGRITKNLENLQNALRKKLESMPEKAGEMSKTLTLLSSEKYDIWTEAINKVATLSPKKKDLSTLIEKWNHSKKTHQLLNEWKVAFEQLPPDSSSGGIITFNLPKHTGFDFNILSNPERIESIFQSIKEAKSSIQQASQICEEYKVELKSSKINDMIKSYAKLLRVLKSPSEPKGDPALISELADKTVVSIPLDVALEKMHYLRGIESTPLIHRPKRLGAKKFREEISRVQNEIGTFVARLRSAKKRLSNARKLLKKVKRLRESLGKEIELAEGNKTKNKERLDQLIQVWKNAYHHLCKVFEIPHKEIDLSTRDAVESSFKIILSRFKKAQKIFEQDLVRLLEDHPEYVEKIRISKKQTPADIIKSLTGELEKRIAEMTRLQTEYKKVDEWVLSNYNQIKSLENRDKTREIMTLTLMIAQEVLSRVHEKADVKRIVEELADEIEKNVKDVYSKVFPEDESIDFEHLKEGHFLTTIDNQPITHPSGSQRVAMSIGIMLSLAETFGLPIILDEAFDRIDVHRLKFFSEYITGVSANAPDAPQLCLAGYTTFNIEKNPEVLSFINNWKIYLVERTGVLEKNIQLLKEIPEIE